MAVKTYSYKKDKNVKLSEHFKVGEWRCKDGTDKILIDTSIVKYLEMIIKHFDCKSANIYSGYRTPAHDKKIGADGKGPHTKGYAVDITFTYKSGKKVPSKYICCYAQDLKMKGVAKCDTYGVHLDVKPRTWHADESNNYKIVKDFYDYFKVAKSTIYKVLKGVERNIDKNQLKINISSINVRTSPEIKTGNKKYTAKKGTILNDIETKGLWHRIGTDRWIYKDKNNYTLLPKEELKVEHVVIEENNVITEPITQDSTNTLSNVETSQEVKKNKPKEDFIIKLIEFIIKLFKR